MKYFAQLNGSGEIVSLFEAPDEDAAAYLELTEVVDWTGWAARPSPHHRPFILNGALVWNDPRSLEDLKVAKNAEINAARLAANKSSFTFMGKQIACDELSRSDIDGVNGIVSLTGSLPPSFPGAWKAMDNTYVPIPDVATWIAMYGAMVEQGTANFMYAQSLKATLASATTPEEVDAIVW